MATMTIEDDVKKRAFEIFLERGGINGSDMDDWLKAEAELFKNNKKPPSARKPAKKT